jgi:hypothetical protein
MEEIEIAHLSTDEIPESQRRKIQEVFNLFVKAVKAKLVYPASSRLPQQFKEEMFSRLTMLIDEIGDLSFKVEADRILYGTLEVYRAPSKSDNFAHAFFRDGIINFSFKNGLLAREMESFIDIISRMLRSAAVDDDLATLLWESGFEHISYKLMDDVLNIETFEYGSDAIRPKASPSSTDFKNLFENEINLEITAEDFEVPSEEKKKQRANSYSAAAGSVTDYLKRVTIFSDAEKAEIAEQLAQNSSLDHKAYAINILFEILGLETDNAGYHESLELFGKVRDDYIKMGDFSTAVMLLSRVKEMEQAFRNLKDLKLDKIQGFIESFAASDKIKIVIEAMNTQKDIDYDKAEEYLKMLPWQAITPLVIALGELAHFPARKAVCRALAELSGDKVELLARGVDDPRWYVVRNVVSILGKVNNPKAMGYLRRTIRHQDIRVRKETLISAAKVGTEEAHDFLILALNDEDEKMQIMALKELVQKKVAKAYNQIEKIVLDKDFKERSSDQIKEFLEAMAQLGGEKAFDALNKMASQFSLLASEKQKRLKNYAVRALGYVQSSSATKQLEKIAKSRDHGLADTARRALHRKLKGE